MTPDTYHMTHDMWHMTHGGGWTKMSAPQLLRFGIDSGLKILNKIMTEWMNYKGVYRTSPATSGLLNKYPKQAWYTGLQAKAFPDATQPLGKIHL